MSVTEEEIISHCKDKMAAFKRPKDVLFVDQAVIPKTTTGKIVHRHLKAKLKQGPDGHSLGGSSPDSKRSKKA